AGGVDDRGTTAAIAKVRRETVVAEVQLEPLVGVPRAERHPAAGLLRWIGGVDRTPTGHDVWFALAVARIDQTRLERRADRVAGPDQRDIVVGVGIGRRRVPALVDDRRGRAAVRHDVDG